MKKVILVFFVFLSAYNAFTQCTPDAALTHSGFYPNPLPDGKVGVAYSQTISFQFPSDTTINISPFGPTTIHVDTVIIQSITGFPASYTQMCNATGCKYFNNPLRGCMQIAGTPVAADTGTKKLVVKILVKFQFGGQPFPYPLTDSSQSYKVIPASTGLNRGQVQSYIFGIEQITPNPFTEKTVITITSPKFEKTTIAIRDILGKEVYSQEVNCKTGSNSFSINTEEFKAGYYLISITSSSGVITKKITKR